MCFNRPHHIFPSRYHLDVYNGTSCWKSPTNDPGETSNIILAKSIQTSAKQPSILWWSNKKDAPNGAPPYQRNTIQTLQEFSSPWKFQKAPKEENWRKVCRSSPPWCFFSKRLWWLTKVCLTRGNCSSVSEMWFAMDVTLCPNRSWGVLCFCFFGHIFQSHLYFCSSSSPMYPAARLHMLVQISGLNAGFLGGHS